MTITVTHRKVSTVPNGSDASLVRPSDWNDTHEIVGLGTAAALDAGSGANQLVQLDNAGKLPAVDGSQLTGIATGAAGSDTQVQFNDGGAFGGDSGLTFNKTAKALTLGGGTVTTNAPVLDLSQTWNDGGTTFTGLKLNATDTASASGSLLMDLQVGGSSKFNITKAGTINVSGNIISTPASINIEANSLGARFGDWSVNPTGIGVDLPGIFYFTNSTSNASFFFADTFLTRRAAANLRLGAADAAAPVAQTLSVQSVSSGTSNTAGVNFTIDGSQGTGTGAGGSIVFRVAPAGASGTAVNGLQAALTLTSAKEAKCAGPLWVSNAYTAGAPTPTGYIVLYDSTGTAYKVPAEAL